MAASSCNRARNAVSGGRVDAYRCVDRAKPVKRHAARYSDTSAVIVAWLTAV
ncbi:MAG: hypothetical protein IPJ78_18900, partial [Gemmatimonadetes bacterium]|nr:hypothetical protein [Gemmatimonadota bacterium]